MSSYYAAETITDARRWELPLLQGYAEAAPPPTAEEIDNIERAAYEEGYARGHADGQAQGYADGAALVRAQAQALRAVFDHCAKPLRELDGEVERMLVALAIEVGRRLAQQTLAQDPAAVVGIVREALSALAQPVREAAIHLHPADVGIVEATVAGQPEAAGWRLVPDIELMRGDVRVVTDAAQVDARLDTREAGIAQALLGERG